ncbi:MAG: cytochrome c3 family protein [Planctomycetota bacterium]
MFHALSKDTRFRLILAAVALGALGCAVALNAARPAIAPNVVRAPARAAPVAAAAAAVVGGPRLTHANHVERGLECTDCHETNEQTGEPSYPDLETCWDCHEDIEDEAGTPPEKSIKRLFFTEDGKPRWQRAIEPYGGDLLFSHRAHAEKTKCADCHGTMEGERRLAKPLFTMTECRSCHQERGAPTGCAACHGKIRDDVPPVSHQTAWETRHGKVVFQEQRAGEQPNCGLCHAQASFCNDCHQNRLPASHREGTWEQGHGQRVWQAKGARQAGCTFCHRNPAFCDGCHRTRLPSSHKRLWEKRHGMLARTGDMSGLTRCGFCHDDPSFCEDCHQDEPPQDHGALFRTRTHGLMAALDRTRCRFCHQTDFCVRCHEYTAPRSHRAQWSIARNTHCVVCHMPLSSNPNCSTCHKGAAPHSTAPDMPAGHNPASDCRLCHRPGGLARMPHVDPGTPCQLCHN